MFDGHPNDCPWGRHFFPLDAGPHQIEICSRYLGRRAGKVSVRIDVAPSQVIEASYRAPTSIVIAFLFGKLILETSANAD